ncbi:MAG: redox-sensing transcriptional repressor Rex [Clostridia bacterium]|nr:redox-sensing transcriptional repressor Rex [Clostridia bacterium]MBQ9507208.1 redox-sensing transcriptional repressor Rex [Clostridia bacterium]MBR5423286.1 redox-sensing transcriptional repressor Rex [Clostridia bacterium]
MKAANEISSSVIGRLPRYYRFLCELRSAGAERISSGELSKRMGLTASQIRQDFNCFGGFGQQGYGYNVEQLKNEMAMILGLNTPKKAILIGAGNLGRAVAAQMRFDDMGFHLIGIFDIDETYQGLKIKGIPIRTDRELYPFCSEHRPEMAILCLPQSKAPAVVDELILLGIDSFWNFSHYDIHGKYPGANVENVHLSDSLMTLSYKIKNSESR